MKHLWTYVKKVLVALFLLLIALILHEWYALYNDKDFRQDLSQGDRLKESLAASLLYTIWGTFATIGRVFSGGDFLPEKVQ